MDVKFYYGSKEFTHLLCMCVHFICFIFCWLVSHLWPLNKTQTDESQARTQTVRWNWGGTLNNTLFIHNQQPICDCTQPICDWSLNKVGSQAETCALQYIKTKMAKKAPVCFYLYALNCHKISETRVKALFFLPWAGCRWWDLDAPPKPILGMGLSQKIWLTLLIILILLQNITKVKKMELMLCRIKNIKVNEYSSNILVNQC